ncbi:barstar family protein [Brevibacillus sp. NPDC058079]|uniref:barstar family protein n=1 Tax=Brevibacillus sp. NPDC058079 TaxID=3346330 RepID=UPI002EC797FF|nr:barstar family protein [Bacillus thuringiensis]
MKIIKINGEEFTSRDNLHSILRSKLVEPEHYDHTYWGNNLDSLWECLTAWIELPLTIEWLNYEKSVEYLGDYAEKLLQVFTNAEKNGRGFKVVVK